MYHAKRRAGYAVPAEYGGCVLAQASLSATDGTSGLVTKWLSDTCMMVVDEEDLDGERDCVFLYNAIV